MYIYSTESIPVLKGLEDGWMFGRKMDVFDAQWSAFRSSLPLLCAVALLHTLCISACGSVFARFRVQLLFGIAFVLVLYGYKIIYIVGVSSLNYGLRYMFRGKNLTIATWIFSLLSLILVSGTGDDWPMFSFLRRFAGMERWSHHFNMIVLKMISYGVDYQKARYPVNEEKRVYVKNSYKERQELSLPIAEYSFANYISYLLYPPLVLAGPIITFNAWQSQMVLPQKTYSPKAIVLYIFRWIGVFIIMEGFAHFNYSNAIAAQKGVALENMSSLLLGLAVSICVLFYMWLKFLLIWRFFRIWSLLLGIETPENMTRCVLNNYSIAKFWKGWHSSFNLWIVRYIYIPLGGKNQGVFTQLLNISLVFLFVALWHDLDWRVFHWAFLVSLVFVPELVGTMVFKKMRIPNPQIAKHICIAAGSFNVLLLMACNLVGYVFGMDGLSVLIDLLVKTATPIAIILISSAIYSGVSLMMYLEERKYVHI